MYMSVGKNRLQVGCKILLYKLSVDNVCLSVRIDYKYHMIAIFKLKCFTIVFL